MIRKIYKKVLFIGLSLAFILSITYKSNANNEFDDNLITKESLSDNVINPQYVYNDYAYICYKAWIPLTEEKYTVIIQNICIEAEEDNDECYMAFELKGKDKITVNAYIDTTHSVNIFKLDLSQYKDSYSYFRPIPYCTQYLNSIYNDEDYSKHFFINKGDSIKPTPFVPLDDYVKYDNNKNVIVTNTKNKINVNLIKDSIKSYDLYGVKSTTLVEDNYSSNYLTPGDYNVLYKVEDNNGAITNVSFLVHVYKEAVGVIEGPDEVNVYISKDYGDAEMGLASDIEKLYKGTCGESEVYFNCGFCDQNGDNYDNTISMMTIIKKPGSYYLLLKLIKRSGQKCVATKVIKINVIDDEGPSVYVPNSFVALSDLDNASDDDLYSYFLHIKGFLDKDISNVVMLSNTYRGHENEIGEYKVVYSYTKDNQTYIEALNLNVSSNIDTPTVVNNIEDVKQKSKDYNNIIYILLIIGLFTSFITYYSIKRCKNRKR
ncbi:MAG: hypothetical protein K6G28_03115 [Acholeplasmatales bacterium]|nr:hypothetical protein [Acholeplasmatales bacterium]